MAENLYRGDEVAQNVGRVTAHRLGILSLEAQKQSERILEESVLAETNAVQITKVLTGEIDSCDLFLRNGDDDTAELTTEISTSYMKKDSYNKGALDLLYGVLNVDAHNPTYIHQFSAETFPYTSDHWMPGDGVWVRSRLTGIMKNGDRQDTYCVSVFASGSNQIPVNVLEKAAV